MFESEGNLLVIEAAIPVSENDSSGGRGDIRFEDVLPTVGNQLV